MSGHAPRLWAQALVACVVLIGLFLMHGLPGSNCAGQPDGSSSSMTSASMMPAAISPAVMSDPSMGLIPSLLAQSVEAAERAVGASVALSAAGGLCVSRPPPSGLAGLLALLLLVVGALALGGMTGLAGPTGRFPRGRGRRASPLAGAVLLVSLCISRT